ncbi:MAG: hypothetical protein K9K66_19430 [Desulfarculaceae bacterium]|nr:hypothetical protein [Desulfarculaceae bacterium]MCF8074369.1 hypothetical protein [Desulfarculaceae bacterium]MCF8103828.1 hypothetical protein [Desulfarculaceae bacterium]MCF8117298.1 hypothetical protein [Desulfarculaceae bacterium]
MSDTVALVGGIYILLCCLLAGWIAQKKGDFYSRGFTIGLMAGIFAPIFLAMAPSSRARAGNDEDRRLWHMNGVFATIFHVAAIAILWMVWTAMA